ncbi:BREX-1 system phosphatase PglZ type A [Streptomyces sp. ME02-8801-2C]|uniref:BREX-1 system phosphatase PglZ type A n=1 Tax=Streptomyces sp. ME02-8801-2C TaxID=3028680 RepID=UPI0029A07A32|nr:BREX-1 system phosphatase PglZ type A [Streptomyces sp. ME02-8801-2C]MDX3453585.1 BREX-1 system phosphatase PglZ type A [Streptomyces sp. ME02-8801-2C]
MRLGRLFETQRVVFWHDPAGEHTASFEALDLPGVEVVRVQNNEFALKHRFLREEPETKFLVYRSGQIPEKTGNWLLDQELAWGVFSADKATLLRQDLGLDGEDVDEALAAHEAFFADETLVAALKPRLAKGDGPLQVRAKMSAVLLEEKDHSLQEITRRLLVEHASGKGKGKGKHTAFFDRLAEHDLDAYFWQGAASIYGYQSAQPSMDDFVLWLFTQASRRFPGQDTAARNIRLDFESWRNDRRSQEAMQKLAEKVAQDISYADQIENRDFHDLLEDDVFPQTEQKIISALAGKVADRTIPAGEVAEIVRKRKLNSLWYDRYEAAYQGLETAADLITRLWTIDLSIASFDDGLTKYCTGWYVIDQRYRQFLHQARTLADRSDVLEHLREQINRQYLNRFLQPLGEAWSQQLHSLATWKSDVLRPQTKFFHDHVVPLHRKDRRVVVIISDALRYEVADDLKSEINGLDKYSAVLDAESTMLGVLPSYTQMGMAALLPHITIGLTGKDDQVQVDGQSAGGAANRSKILAEVGGSAVKADDVLSMKRDGLRALLQEHKVVYVYHNRIDAVGDKMETERNTPEAVAATLEDLKKLVRLLMNAYAGTVIITADHGFLYQEIKPIDPDFVSEELPQGDEIFKQARRYVLGKGLKAAPALHTFTAAQIGLEGEGMQVQVPRANLRLRRSGSGTRFVHGGASLQEVVVPVVKVTKKRTSDLSQVGVRIMAGGDKITTGQVVVRFYQEDAVTEKVQARTVRVGLYVDDMLISNQPELHFDRTSEDKRDRFQDVRLLLSREADEFNGRTVELRLEEPIAGTTGWKAMPQKATYTLKRSFTSDFDF